MGTLSHPLRHAMPLTGGADDYTPLLDRIGDARFVLLFVLLGEAAQGTHELSVLGWARARNESRSRGTLRIAVPGDTRILALRDVAAGRASVAWARRGASGSALRRNARTARLMEQPDAVVHIDRTRAVEPRERAAEWIGGELPESDPFTIWLED